MKLTVLMWGTRAGVVALIAMLPAIALSMASREFKAIFLVILAFTAITAAGYWVARNMAPDS